MQPMTQRLGAPASRGARAVRAVGALGAGSTGAAAALTTIVAGTCCVSPVIAPVIVGLLGASGAAWAAGMQRYSVEMLIASFALLVAGFWLVYRRRARCAAEDAAASESASSQPASERAGVTRWSSVAPHVAKAVLWIGAASWVAALVVHLAIS